MTSGTRVTTIRVELRSFGEGLIATSDHVPGLHVWGPNEDEVCARTMIGIKLLYKHNHGLDVDVYPATEPTIFPDLPSMGCSSFAIATRT
jgi:hypothetical protein